MIIRQITKKHDLSVHARWFVVVGQLSLWIGILLTQLDYVAAVLLGGILIGISLVANLTYLQVRSQRNNPGGAQ